MTTINDIKNMIRSYIGYDNYCGCIMCAKCTKRFCRVDVAIIAFEMILTTGEYH